MRNMTAIVLVNNANCHVTVYDATLSSSTVRLQYAATIKLTLHDWSQDGQIIDHLTSGQFEGGVHLNREPHR